VREADREHREVVQRIHRHITQLMFLQIATILASLAMIVVNLVS
jgi:hypothetical protein